MQMKARRLGSVAAVLLCACSAYAGPVSGAARAATAPTINRELSANVGVSTATIEAQVNPGEAATSYHFEYGTSTSYGTSVPLPDATIGAGTSDATVTVQIADLHAGATYHYRVVADNAEGTTVGPDRSLRTFASAESGEQECSNALIRNAQSSTYLPDCRAYEMVSPVDKDGGNIAADATFTQSSVNGNAVKYYSTTAFGDAQGIETRGAEYVSQRGEAGWTTHSINPEQGSTSLVAIFAGSQYQYLSPDLSQGVYFALTPVTPGHPDVERAANLYLRNDILSGPPGNYELLSDCPGCGQTPLPARPQSAQGLEVAFAGASADLDRIFFESVNKLTVEAANTNPAVPKLYEWHDGVLRLAGVLPDGEPAEGSVAGAGAGGGTGLGEGGWTEDAVSSDGSRVVFTSVGPGSEEEAGYVGNLYMRIDSSETIQLNESERSVPDPRGPQPAKFWAATADGSRVYFATREMLTDDSPEGADNLYMYDAAAPAGKRLTLISVDSEPGGQGDANNAETGAAVTGVSADGSYVYFVDRKDLVPGQPPFSRNTNGGALFVWHDGVVRYIASHDHIGLPYSATAWGERGRQYNSNFRVDRSGLQAVFTSSDPQTAREAGYENHAATPSDCVGGIETEANEEILCDEVYLYDYASNKVVCVSCDTSGAAPVGDSGFEAQWAVDNAFNFSFTDYSRTQYRNNAISDDGRYVFFDTTDALVPRDTNHRRDVYEYDTATGEVHLISSGTCACDSEFVDASPDGKNVFFITQQQLVLADIDANADLYDARVGGGIEAQNVAPSAPCEGDDCQGPVGAPPVFSLPASATFSGLGNAGTQVGTVTKKKPRAKKQKPRAKHKAKSKGKQHRKAKRRAKSTRRVNATRSRLGQARSAPARERASRQMTGHSGGGAV